MYNRIILIGRLTADPTLRYTPQGTPVATFTLAVNRRFNREETDFINIVTWRQLAERCAQYISKGRLVALEGSLQIRNYTDKDGNRRQAAEVIADNVTFLGGKSDSSNGNNISAGFGSNNGSRPNGGYAPQNSDWEALGQEVRVDEIDGSSNHDDDLPF